MDSAILQKKISTEASKRRTFAIISHPDAGKTTLTEKTLLYCGAIHEAGEVTAKANRRKTVSDWMELEKQRGISVSSSVLQFEYKGLHVNLLDTPGHQDFSEDTYRTLMAADCAVMVIDVAKGVEAQTIKLFEVCRMRGLPVFTFINKLDREGRDPFELMEEIEGVLGMGCNPLTWPIGMGPSFRGVYHRLNREFVFFDPPEKAGFQAQARSIKCEPNDKQLLEHITEEEQQKLIEEIDLIEGGLGPIDQAAFNEGRISPVVFASAKSGFGLSTFLDIFHKFAPQPSEKRAIPHSVKPQDPRFSAFVFKIQANMDKKHRDRLAFLRICSGQFRRDMDVKHSRLGKEVRLTHSKQFMAQDRETVDEAYAGDIIGIHDPGHFQIGDTLFTGSEKLEFEGIPQFSPENFGRLVLRDPMKRKQLQKGISQLSEEGMIQMFIDPRVGVQDPYLGVVGPLQFDVMMHRLEGEYGVQARLERLPYQSAEWILPKDPNLDMTKLDLRVALVKDSEDNWVALFKSDWESDYTKKNAPKGLDWYPNSFEASKAQFLRKIEGSR
ncbi:peptide chain release factor 3 [bacterium]|nr:peptide chain release factor 3 [bacterium]